MASESGFLVQKKWLKINSAINRLIGCTRLALCIVPFWKNLHFPCCYLEDRKISMSVYTKSEGMGLGTQLEYTVLTYPASFSEIEVPVNKVLLSFPFQSLIHVNKGLT